MQVVTESRRCYYTLVLSLMTLLSPGRVRVGIWLTVQHVTPYYVQALPDMHTLVLALALALALALSRALALRYMPPRPPVTPRPGPTCPPPPPSPSPTPCAPCHP